MLLEIAVDVFERGDNGPVVRLFKLVTAGQHEWLPTIEVALAADRFVQDHALKMDALPELMGKIVEESASRRKARQAPVQVLLEQLDDVVDDLGQPAVIVVENGQNEMSFLVAAARAFGHEHIVRAIEHKPGWLKVCNSGGTGDMQHQVAYQCRDFKVIVRVVALLDSDRKIVGLPESGIPHQRTSEFELTDGNEQKRRDLLAAGASAVHMWDGHEVENFLPPVAWQRRYRHKSGELALVNALLPQQRAYVDLKKVIGRPKPLIPEGIDLTEEDFVELGDHAVADIKKLLAMIDQIL